VRILTTRTEKKIENILENQFGFGRGKELGIQLIHFTAGG
jgi:hypothetical protein